jgi:regulator of cell morphogenesis and NO signaling
MDLTHNHRIGEIAARHPLATRVFDRHGIDFCCGGGKALGDACAERDLSPEDVLDEIRATLSSEEPTDRRWDEASVSDLIQHILEDYHEPLREELPRLEAMTRKVVRVHGARDPERFTELLETIVELKKNLELHLDREERELFPEILKPGGSGTLPISALEEEHSEAGEALARLRELTDGYRAPEGACNTWRALWHGLAALESSLHRHIHLENHVLFPRLKAG